MGFVFHKKIHALWGKNGLSWTIIALRIVSLLDYVKKLKYSILYYLLEGSSSSSSSNILVQATASSVVFNLQERVLLLSPLSKDGLGWY